ncbi:MAG TPA: PEP/pyruvate-binding domain-containing protein [Propionibacteriaceae bacterium]|nr:PEP/pyruvate-binding domain-containing protein [Propionibacteriaceae bacterium]
MIFIKQFDELGRDDIDQAGGKGANLGELTRAGFPVPPGFVIVTDAYRAYGAEHQLAGKITTLAAPTDDPGGYESASQQIRALFTDEISDALRDEVARAYAALGEDVPVAVRSSATAEDLPEASFAGQQDTYLNVRGLEDLLAAVRDCWASLWTSRAMAYRARQGIDPATVSLAVVVQHMVHAEAAGVMFTANPSNGRRDQVVISAAWGLGESVVSGSVNTDNIVVRKPDGAVESSETADKAVMTVPAERRTQERPVPAEQRRQPVLSDSAAAELAGYGTRIEDHYGAPQDIEWALANGQFFILQARPITALPEAESPIPTDWPVPDPSAMYVRASIVEQLPDPLTPLFADMIDGAVTRSLQRLFQEFIGEEVIRYHDVGLPTINGYAYYGYSRSGMARLMWKSPRAFQALLTGASQPRWRNYSHPRYRRIVNDWAARDLKGMTSAQLLDGVQELVDAAAEYYTAVQTIIPIAATSEILFTWFYDAAIRQKDDPPAQVFVLGSDSQPIRAEKSLYDLATWTRDHRELAETLSALSPREFLERAGTSQDPVWHEWHTRFQAHLNTFGHTIYNLDFANPVPADDPVPLLETLRFFVSGKGSDPYQRQRSLATRREQATAVVLARLDPVRAKFFRRLLHWAQSVAPVREDALADVGLAWPQVRRMLLEIGRRLQEAGVISDSEGVFWLHRSEIAEGVGNLADQVEQRKAVWRGQLRATPPQLLPKGGWGDMFRKWMPAASEEQTGDVIKGIAGSMGAVTAPARVLGGPQEFGQMRPGDVLVASITTPAWTSLFAMASGVVTDIGGPLSHSSIVAREYGIPAVLGTAVATRRIHSGQMIKVDGDAGTVTLLDGKEPEAIEPVAKSLQRSKIIAGAAGGAAAVGLTAWLVRRRGRSNTAG